MRNQIGKLSRKLPKKEVEKIEKGGFFVELVDATANTAREIARDVGKKVVGVGLLSTSAIPEGEPVVIADKPISAITPNHSPTSIPRTHVVYREPKKKKDLKVSVLSTSVKSDSLDVCG